MQSTILSSILNEVNEGKQIFAKFLKSFTSTNVWYGPGDSTIYMCIYYDKEYKWI